MIFFFFAKIDIFSLNFHWKTVFLGAIFLRNRCLDQKFIKIGMFGEIDVYIPKMTLFYAIQRIFLFWHFWFPMPRDYCFIVRAMPVRCFWVYAVRVCNFLRPCRSSPQFSRIEMPGQRCPLEGVCAQGHRYPVAGHLISTKILSSLEGGLCPALRYPLKGPLYFHYKSFRTYLS